MATDYGTDVSCVSDFTSEFREVSGQRLVAEALVRRLMTPRGMNPEDDDYGTDLREWIGQEVTPRSASRLIADVKSECVKDERVADAAARVTSFSRSTGTIEMEIDVTTVIGETFTLTARVSAVTVELLTP